MKFHTTILIICMFVRPTLQIQSSIVKNTCSVCIRKHFLLSPPEDTYILHTSTTSSLRVISYLKFLISYLDYDNRLKICFYVLCQVLE